MRKAPERSSNVIRQLLLLPKSKCLRLQFFASQHPHDEKQACLEVTFAIGVSVFGEPLSEVTTAFPLSVPIAMEMYISYIHI